MKVRYDARDDALRVLVYKPFCSAAVARLGLRLGSCSLPNPTKLDNFIRITKRSFQTMYMIGVPFAIAKSAADYYTANSISYTLTYKLLRQSALAYLLLRIVACGILKSDPVLILRLHSVCIFCCKEKTLFYWSNVPSETEKK